MRMKNTLFFLLVIIVISIFGCSNEWKDGNYVVRDSPSDPSQKILYLELSGGKAQKKVDHIKMIGKSDTHIIVETTNNKYWILEKSNEFVMGPLSLDDFKLLSFKMRLGDIDLEKL